MRYLGHSVQERDPKKLEEAKRLILRARLWWAAFSNSTYIKDLAHRFIDFMLEGENAADVSSLVDAGATAIRHSAR